MHIVIVVSASLLILFCASVLVGFLTPEREYTLDHAFDEIVYSEVRPQVIPLQHAPEDMLKEWVHNDPTLVGAHHPVASLILVGGTTEAHLVGWTLADGTRINRVCFHPHDSPHELYLIYGNTEFQLMIHQCPGADGTTTRTQWIREQLHWRARWRAERLLEVLSSLPPSPRPTSSTPT